MAPNTGSLPTSNPGPFTATTLSRARSSRTHRRYGPAIETTRLHQRLLRRLDRSAIRHAIEHHALASRHDDVLLELLCAFTIERALRELGWSLNFPGLVTGGAFVRGIKGQGRLTVWYQHAPRQLAVDPAYENVQAAHRFPTIGPLRPDFVLEISTAEQRRLVIMEVKGVQRAVGVRPRSDL